MISSFFHRVVISRQYCRLLLLFLAGVISLNVSCIPKQVTQGEIRGSIIVDVLTVPFSLPVGSTVQEALVATGTSISQLDRVDPPLYTVLSDGVVITIVRVTEEFKTVQDTIPFIRQELRNEALLTGETRLVQAGQNGIREVTIRHVYENGVEVSRTVVSEAIIQSPMPEIIMIGVQSSYTPIQIPGMLAYLTSGNAWIIENSTSIRRPIVTTGDLDGRVFSLSPDGNWLLFTRSSSRDPEEEINTLWAVSTTSHTPTLINLRVANVVHFAEWIPNRHYAISYTTVEPRAIAPGWQANNDLFIMPFYSGSPGRPRRVLESSAGGIYGWWGTTFAWSPDGERLLYSRPDGIGFVDIAEESLVPLIDITPLNTYSDWAWIPPAIWGSDGGSLYYITHALPTGLINPEESPYFDLNAISFHGGIDVTIEPQTGMFAFLSSSPLRYDQQELGFSVAFLQAIFPAQSETSRYRLVVLDRDGSNHRIIFPDEGLPGLEPQKPAWSPESLPGGGEYIGIVYQRNLWIVDSITGEAQQITGDGSTIRIDWK